MTLTRWHFNKPAVPDTFSNLLEQLFDTDFLGRERTSLVPSVNVTEAEKNFVIDVAAPGMEKKDFKVNIDKNILTISSEKEKEKNENENVENYSRKEFNYSSFRRSFSLPEDVLTNKINASYDKGILSIILPKKEEAKDNGAKEIKIV